MPTRTHGKHARPAKKAKKTTRQRKPTTSSFNEATTNKTKPNRSLTRSSRAVKEEKAHFRWKEGEFSRRGPFMEDEES